MMSKFTKYGFVAWLFGICFGCTSHQIPGDCTDSQLLYLGGLVVYPYQADELRRRTILDNYERIQAGMEATDVRKILGAPDEIKQLHYSKDGSTLVGWTYWYILERGEREGSRYRNEHVVRISLDLNKVVLRIDTWKVE